MLRCGCVLVNNNSKSVLHAEPYTKRQQASLSTETRAVISVTPARLSTQELSGDGEM